MRYIRGSVAALTYFLILLGSAQAQSGLLSALSLAQQTELIYIGYFDRSADAGGFNFWEGQDATAQGDGQTADQALTNIANSFTPQAETVAIYPFLTTPSPNFNDPTVRAGLTTFIENVYGNLFHRSADGGGLAYWTSQIESGAIGLGAAVLAIANGAQGSDATILQNKITVALNFTNLIGAANLPVTSALLTEAKTVLAGVDGNSLNDASVTTAEALIPQWISSQQELPSARNASANWQMAGMLSVGGIPTRTTVCATVNPRGSGLDDTTNIQNAVNACPAGEVVSLAAGTFTVGEGNFVLLNNGITLRGAGPCAGILTCTLIQRTNGCPPLSPSSNGNCGSAPSPFIIVGPEQYNNFVYSTNLTADAAQGATSVQVTSTSGFSIGQFVLLDEMSNASYQPDVGVGGSSQIWAASDYRVVWQKHNPSQSFDDFSSSQYPYQTGTAGCWFATGIAPNGPSGNRCDRPTSEIKHISAISGNTITFDSPITISYRVANTAQLSYYMEPFTTYASVEDLTMQGADDQSLEFMLAAA